MKLKEEKFFQENGYLIMRDLIKGKHLKSLLEEINELCLSVTNGDYIGNHLFERSGITRVITNPYDACPTLRKLVNSKNMIQFAKGVLGNKIQLHHSKLMCKATRAGTRQCPHQDYYYWRKHKPNQFAVFLCIDANTKTNGCLRIIPRSHKLGLLKHHKEFPTIENELHWACNITPEMKKSEVSFIGKPGDVILFSSLTIHRSKPNKSDQSRRSLIFEYDQLNNLIPPIGWGAPQHPVQWT